MPDKIARRSTTRAAREANPSALLPAILAFLLSVVQLIASRQLWPQANLTLAELSGLWSALIPIVQGAGGLIKDWQGGSCADGGQILAAGDARVHAQAMKLLAD